jgi:hypothetical protein
MSKKRKSLEYHLICRSTGESHGGFATLAGAREFVREEGLEAWDIFNGNRLVERRELIRVNVGEKSRGAWEIFRGRLVAERHETLH